MKFLKTIFTDILYVSKITGTQRKKLLITTSVLFSQLSVFTDVFLIALFAFLIADQKTNISQIDYFTELFSQNKFLILILVFLRFIFLFYQSFILRKIEFTVAKNLKVYILGKIFEKRTYSIADSYFYTNELSSHIGYFYSNFAAFLNNLLQIFVFCIYLVISNFQILTIFAAGLILLFFPIKKIISLSRKYVDKTYHATRDSMYEIERVIQNLFLIKILKQENVEISKFSSTLTRLNSHLLNGHTFNLLNGYLPSFLTLFILSFVIIFFSSTAKLTLDFIGVTLKLFNSISGLSVSFSNIINSHVHISKFKELEFDKPNVDIKNFKIEQSSHIKFNNVSFKYQNSENYIFENIDIKFEKGAHTIITGENGTGKSTLLGLIAAIYYPSSGEIISFSNRFGYVSAQPFIFTDTLRNNIMYGIDKDKISDETITKHLKKFNTFKNVSDYDLDRIISTKTLSSGQMQKIGFVRILLTNPDIILLDESTSNLDEKSKKQVFEVLKENNSTIINSTHDPASFNFVDTHFDISVIGEKRTIKKIK